MGYEYLNEVKIFVRQIFCVIYISHIFKSNDIQKLYKILNVIFTNQPKGEKEMSYEHEVKPLKVIDQKVEIFEVYSPHLGKKVRIGLKHNPDNEINANLQTDGGIVMMPAPE